MTLRVAAEGGRQVPQMGDGAPPHRTDVYSLGAAFVLTATIAFLGMRWNALEPRWALPVGTKVMLVAAAVVSAFVRILGRTPPRATILTVGAAVPAGAFIAIVVGMLRDPASQNLWPIGLAFLGVVSLALSVLGTVVGGLLLRLVDALRANTGT